MEVVVSVVAVVIALGCFIAIFRSDWGKKKQDKDGGDS
jgi:hypothetical protein